MALKTLDPTLKATFTNAGITLSPEQEHIAALQAIDWVALIQKLANLAATIIPIVIALFGGSTPPTPAPANAKQGVTCPCDHHACCKKTFDAAIHTAKIAGDHLAACCCENC